MREHTLDPVEPSGPREEVLRDLEPQLAADEHVRVDQPIEGHVDGTLGVVLDRHDAEVGALVLDVVEHLGDRLRRAVGHRRAEALERRLMREGGRRPEVGDRQSRLERAARGEDLAPDGADRLGAQQTIV